MSESQKEYIDWNSVWKQIYQTVDDFTLIRCRHAVEEGVAHSIQDNVFESVQDPIIDCIESSIRRSLYVKIHEFLN